MLKIGWDRGLFGYQNRKVPGCNQYLANVCKAFNSLRPQDNNNAILQENKIVQIPFISGAIPENNRAFNSLLIINECNQFEFLPYRHYFGRELCIAYD